MKPCDCRTYRDVKELKEQGIAFNNVSIVVDSPGVILEISPHVQVKFTRETFKQFAEWYLEDQI